MPVVNVVVVDPVVPAAPEEASVTEPPLELVAFQVQVYAVFGVKSLEEKVKVDVPLGAIVSALADMLAPAANAPGTKLPTSASAMRSARSLRLIDFITFSFLPFPLGQSPW